MRGPQWGWLPWVRRARRKAAQEAARRAGEV
jgi:hypothetical protein